MPKNEKPAIYDNAEETHSASAGAEQQPAAASTSRGAAGPEGPTAADLDARDARQGGQRKAMGPLDDPPDGPSDATRSAQADDDDVPPTTPVGS